jgi:hypothetical protein
MDYNNDNPLAIPTPILEETYPGDSQWLQDKAQLTSIEAAFNNNYKTIASKMVAFIYHSLYGIDGFKVQPIYFDIPECCVSIKVPGKLVCMYMVRVVSMFDLSVSITPLTSKKEPSLIVDTPSDALRILYATRDNI